MIIRKNIQIGKFEKIHEIEHSKIYKKFEIRKNERNGKFEKMNEMETSNFQFLCWVKKLVKMKGVQQSLTTFFMISS